MCSRASFFSSRRRHTRYWRDWSSDVLFRSEEVANKYPATLALEAAFHAGKRYTRVFGNHDLIWKRTDTFQKSIDRKSVVSGKSVDLGGCSIIKKKNNGIV